MSAQLATARASSLAAENRAGGLAKALAQRAAAAVSSGSELVAARRLAEDARAAAKADKAAATAALDENQRLREELRNLSELSKQASSLYAEQCILHNSRHAIHAGHAVLQTFRFL